MDGFGNKNPKNPPVSKLTHDPEMWQRSLFCNTCPDLGRCGGIATQLGGHCYMHCCGGKAACQTVCRQNPQFQAQMREIAGFDLANVPHVKPVSQLPLSGTAPLLVHGKVRQSPVASDIVAVKLRELVQMTNGRLRYSDREELATALKFAPDAHVVVTGIEQDKWVEPWWSLGRENRKALLREFSRLNVALVTPPNFSLFCDQPRPNDFSAMKRIALVQAEFLEAGIPCALHPHIITETDSLRWADFVAARPEIQTIAYEFTTGAGLRSIRSRHIDHLIRLAHAAGRELDLVVRGDQKILSELAPYFGNVLYIDTNAFMKTMHRRLAVRTSNRDLRWKAVTTPQEISVERLLQHNVSEVAVRSRLLVSEAL